MQDDAGCQPISSTPEKNRSRGPAGKHSLTPNSKFASEPNRRGIKVQLKIVINLQQVRWTLLPFLIRSEVYCLVLK